MTEKRKGVIALILLSIVFATMGIFSRYLSTSFELFEQTYLRIGTAFIIGIILFYKKLDFSKLKEVSKKDLSVFIFRAITLYLGVVLFTESILHANYGNAAFIAALPILPIFGYVFLKEKLSLKIIISILIGFVGMLLIAIPDMSILKFGYGEMMALLSVAAFDLSYISRRWHSEHLTNIESTVLIFFIGAILLFITSILLGEQLPTVNQFTPFVIGTIIIASLFNIANLYLVSYGFQRLKAGIAGNILTLETVFALLYSIFLFKEIPHVREFVGGFIILLSVWLVNRFEDED